jgi:heptosyltransferase-2
MKILIIQTAFIGDVVLATPLIEKLKSKHPNSRIDFLLRKGNETLLLENPHLNKVLIFDKKKNKYRNLIRLIKVIRSESYDYAINIQRFFTTGLITSFSGAKVKIGFDKNPLSFTFTHKVRHSISEGKNIHEVQRNLSLIKNIAGDGFQMPKLYPSKSDYKIVPTHEYICIAPSSVWFTKQFPVNKWCELINKIPQSYKIYLIGGPDDVVLCEKIREGTDIDRIEVLAGQLTFLQSVALIEKAKMTFTNDSAPLHFASAVNAPVTAIYCSTIPQFGFGPLSDIAHVVETDEKLTCRPCGLHGKKECPQQHFKCSNISVEKILKKLP